MLKKVALFQVTIKNSENLSSRSLLVRAFLIQQLITNADAYHLVANVAKILILKINMKCT